MENFFDFAFLIKEKYAAETFNAVSHRPEAVYTTPQMMAGLFLSDRSLTWTHND